MQCPSTKPESNIHSPSINTVKPSMISARQQYAMPKHDDTDCTNNSTEGWNNRFGHILSLKHPSIWILIGKMRDELAADEIKLAQQADGRVLKKKKTLLWQSRRERLKVICGDYINNPSHERVI